MGDSRDDPVPAALQRLTAAFFAAVSFAQGDRPDYAQLHALFIARGLPIKNSGAEPEIATVAEFIAPRQASVDSGELTRFHEAEIAHVTDVFGNERPGLELPARPDAAATRSSGPAGRV